MNVFFAVRRWLNLSDDNSQETLINCLKYYPHAPQPLYICKDYKTLETWVINQPHPEYTVYPIFQINFRQQPDFNPLADCSKIGSTNCENFYVGWVNLTLESEPMESSDFSISSMFAELKTDDSYKDFRYFTNSPAPIGVLDEKERVRLEEIRCQQFKQNQLERIAEKATDKGQLAWLLVFLCAGVCWYISGFTLLVSLFAKGGILLPASHAVNLVLSLALGIPTTYALQKIHRAAASLLPSVNVFHLKKASRIAKFNLLVKQFNCYTEKRLIEKYQDLLQQAQIESVMGNEKLPKTITPKKANASEQVNASEKQLKMLRQQLNVLRWLNHDLVQRLYENEATRRLHDEALLKIDNSQFSMMIDQRKISPRSKS